MRFVYIEKLYFSVNIGVCLFILVIYLVIMACTVPGCSSRSGILTENYMTVSFHRFPGDLDLRKAWIKNVRKGDKWCPTEHTRICSLHFEETCFRGGYARRTLHSHAKPTIFPNQQLSLQPALMNSQNVVARLGWYGEQPARKGINNQLKVSKKVTKVLCFKCKTEVEPTEPVPEPSVILEPQGRTKAVIAKVYHFLEKEYEQMKKMFGDLDLTPLLKFRQRTAEATGFSENTVAKILKEEKEWYSTQIEPPEKRRRVGEDTSNEMDSLHGSCDTLFRSTENDNSVRPGNLDIHEARHPPKVLVMEVEATNVIRLEPPEADLETLIVKEEVPDDEVYETDNISVPSGAGFNAVGDTMNKEPYEVTLHDPTTACGDVIKTEPEDDGYPVPPARREASIAEDIIKNEPDDDESSVSSSVEDEIFLHIEKIEFTEEEFK